MNAGLSNLATLKAHLLPATMQTATTYDSLVSALGLGLAGVFERLTSREFWRTAGAVEQFGSRRSHYTVRRYPVETVTKLEQRDDASEAWAVLTLADYLLDYDAESGVVSFNSELGPPTMQSRLTYTGGYWWQTSEPSDQTQQTQPTGSTALPSSLLTIWLLQCKQAWKVMDPLGKSIVPGAAGGQLALETLGYLDLLPQVRMVLDTYRRYGG